MTESETKTRYAFVILYNIGLFSFPSTHQIIIVALITLMMIIANSDMV
jgi:hypothetical protein